MRNFTIPEAADGLDRERVPNFAGRKRAAALGSINAFAAALLLAAAVLGLRPANAQVAPGFIPLQVTVDPGTASCEARLRQCFSCGPPPPGSDSQDSSEDGSAVACGNNSASSSLGDLLILEANGNTIGGPTFAAELGPSGAVTIIDFTGHGQAVGAFTTDSIDYHPVRWSSTGAPALLGIALPYTGASALAINDPGQAVGVLQRSAHPNLPAHWHLRRL